MTLTTLYGHPVGTHCLHCTHQFTEDDVATVFASRPVGGEWTIHRTYCDDCSPTAIRHPTLGCQELLVRCRLRSNTDLTISDPEVLASSPPTESHSVATPDRTRDTTLASENAERATVGVANGR